MTTWLRGAGGHTVDGCLCFSCTVSYYCPLVMCAYTVRIISAVRLCKIKGLRLRYWQNEDSRWRLFVLAWVVPNVTTVWWAATKTVSTAWHRHREQQGRCVIHITNTRPWRRTNTHTHSTRNPLCLSRCSGDQHELLMLCVVLAFGGYPGSCGVMKSLHLKDRELTLSPSRSGPRGFPNRLLILPFSSSAFCAITFPRKWTPSVELLQVPFCFHPCPPYCRFFGFCRPLICVFDPQSLPGWRG